MSAPYPSVLSCSPRRRSPRRPEAGDPSPDLYFCFSSQRLWKRGSLRSGSNIGSSRRPAAVNEVAIIAICVIHRIQMALLKSDSRREAAVSLKHCLLAWRMVRAVKLSARSAPAPSSSTAVSSPRRPCWVEVHWRAPHAKQ